MKYFIQALCLICLSGAVMPAAHAQTADPKAPAPAASSTIRIPHSERTKDNILDALIDFTLTKAFARLQDLKISYEFFEIDRTGALNFTNVSALVDKAPVKGQITVKKVKVNFTEFMSFLKEQKLIMKEVFFETVKADMTISEETVRIEETAVITPQQTTAGIEAQAGTKSRRLKFSAGNMKLENVNPVAIARGTEQENSQEKVFEIGGISAENASLTLTNPKADYSAARASVKDLRIPRGSLTKMTVSSAEADGKTYPDINALLQALKK